MLKQYAMKSANGVTIPLPNDADQSPTYENETILNTSEHKQYRSLTGSSLYLVGCTRPDISFPVVVVRSFSPSTCTNFVACETTKTYLRYVAGTVHYVINYPCSVLFSFQSLGAHINADSVGCCETRKSTPTNRQQWGNQGRRRSLWILLQISDTWPSTIAWSKQAS